MFSQANLLAWYGKKAKPNITKACIHQSKEIYYNAKKTKARFSRTTTQNEHKKLKPGLVAFYDIWPGNGASLFSKEKIGKGGDK